MCKITHLETSSVLTALGVADCRADTEVLSCLVSGYGMGTGDSSEGGARIKENL